MRLRRDPVSSLLGVQVKRCTVKVQGEYIPVGKHPGMGSRPDSSGLAA